jgi:hypothetical protein
MDWKEFRFKIDGESDGQKMTPLTLPMARLAEYITELAKVMGFKESVHFVATDTGSAVSVIYVDADEEARVTSHIQNAARGMAASHANDAYKRLDKLLRDDNAIGDIVNVSRNASVIEFPGKRTSVPDVFGPFRERATVIGTLKRLGGFDDSVPVHIERLDGRIFYCETSRSLARELKPFYDEVIRVHGMATYKREEGQWKLEKFRIQSFDPEPVTGDSVEQTLAKLKAIPGNEWNEMIDPLGELHKLRHGEDSQP